MKQLRIDNEQLRMENDQLRLETGKHKQTSKDYSDKLRETEELSSQERLKLRNEMDKMREQFNTGLDEQIRENQALVQKFKDLTIIEIGEAALFGSGQADLTKEGSALVRELAKVFTQYAGYHMRVEGHTDSKPIGGSLKDKYPSNWELSTARATSVIRYMIYGLKIPPETLTAVGYAQYRPIADNETEKGRAKNRRIRIVVFKDLPEQK
ncbi:MAG: hypothetical protein A2V90_05965 [Gammaproteobacteria bacterium RBG_16_57_12]|nr:MAG: hypothetical protein A2V90_05965 [Gammaproteobacteria bacterium RBG_16_57_12]